MGSAFDTMFGNQRDHHNGKRPRRPGDHARASAEDCCNQPDEKRSVQSDQRVHAGHKGKGNGLGDKGEGDGQTRQQFDADKG